MSDKRSDQKPEGRGFMIQFAATLSTIGLVGVLAFSTYSYLSIFFYLTTWDFYLIWLVFCNITTFVLYRLDKWLSDKRLFRIPETPLEVLPFAGGFVGGWAGMFVKPRHKTKPEHYYFRTIMVASTLLHVGLIALMLLR